MESYQDTKQELEDTRAIQFDLIARGDFDLAETYQHDIDYLQHRVNLMERGSGINGNEPSII